jgi:tetratricopeptide (TPR) repeat protein
LEVGNADQKAIEALDFVSAEWLAFGNGFGRFMAAVDEEERCLLLPVTAANLVLSMSSAEGHALGRRYLARARTMAGNANPRERAWMAATEAWLAGDLDKSFALHEKLLAEWPRDLLSGKVAQLHAFNRGDAKAMLRIGERILAANPDNSFVWGMQAFALEECHRLEEAETLAREAIDRQRKDPWAHHAVAHCLEARGRLVEGVDFLRSMADTWEDRHSFMHGHNWWHLALFLIDLDRTDEALDAYDTRVWTADRELADNQVNAISLLVRLELRGVTVGQRWTDVAAHVKGRLHEHYSPFLDLQYLYALARAGEQSAVTEMLASLEDRAERAKPFEREAWADCAVPAGHGLAAHAKGDCVEAARLLSQAVPHLQPIGGSIAQRALFGAIHLDSLVRAGWNDAALKILQTDERERPTVPATKRVLSDLYRRLGRTEQAMTAEYQAEQLARQYRTARGVAA